MKRKIAPLAKKSDPHLNELGLLKAKALVAVKNFLDFKVDENTYKCAERLFREYKSHKDDVKDALIAAFRYLKGRHDKQLVRKAKESLNEVAKKVWK